MWSQQVVSSARRRWHISAWVARNETAQTVQAIAEAVSENFMAWLLTPNAPRNAELN